MFRAAEEIMQLRHSVERLFMICEKMGDITNTRLSKEDLLEINMKAEEIIKQRYPGMVRFIPNNFR